GLSLLDQAIALGGGTTVSAEQVQAMLGLADRARIFDLFTAVVTGKVPESLETLAGLHAAGADPAVVIQDLLELSHFLTRAKLVPATLDAPGQPETERVRGRELSERLSMASLARIWQMLLKSLGEVQSAPIPLQAAEMALIRLAYASELPTPADLVQRLTGGAGAAASAAGGTAGSTAGGNATGGRGSAAAPAQEPFAGPPDAGPEATAPLPPRDQPAPLADGSPQTALAQPLEETFDLLPEEVSQPSSGPDDKTPKSFAAAVALVRGARETMLANHLMDDVHLVSFEPGRIEINVREAAPPNLASRFAAVLEEVCGNRWIIAISQEPGAPTLREQERAAEAGKRAAVMEHPLVKAALETFPDAELVARRDGTRQAGAAETGVHDGGGREERGEGEA
ncbi:MAG TPA: DNA polymerase III subunit gamma/tau, partial [Kiloniellaceae bacterium]|nr:DNA polymerase III subunit gamma/tau [Kiloniellaceae bacterium]